MTRHILALRLLFVTLVLVPAAAVAGPIYNVNRVIGVGTVIGTIETDGTLGVLSSGNVLSFSLTIDDGDGDGPFVISEPGNADLLVVGNLMTATATDIFFDFSGVGGFALFQNPNIGSGQNWWCVEGFSANCAPGPDSFESVNRFDEPTIALRQGNLSIATRAAVPEPVTLTLFGLGLAAAGMRRSRQRR